MSIGIYRGHKLPHHGTASFFILFGIAMRNQLSVRAIAYQARRDKPVQDGIAIRRAAFFTPVCRQTVPVSGQMAFLEVWPYVLITLTGPSNHQPHPERGKTMYGNAVSNQTLSVLKVLRVSNKTGKSRSSIYNAIDSASKYYDETFPRPIRTGANSIGWVESEIDAWIASRARK